MRYRGKYWLAAMLAMAVSVGLTGCQSDIEWNDESKTMVEGGFADEESETSAEGEDTSSSDNREFMDGHKDIYGNERYPAVDYDGDGKTDRVYKTAAAEDSSSKKSDLYLLLGTGESLKLGTLKPAESGQTVSRDLNGDGKPELIYIHTLWTTSGTTNRINVWERTTSGLEKVSLPYSSEKTDGEMVLTLPVKLEKLDSTHVRVTQPESMVSQILEVSEAQMKYVWNSSDGSKTKETSVSSTSISVVADEESGTCRLQAGGVLGSANSSVSVSWELGCEDGQWKIMNLVLGNGQIAGRN